MAAEEEGAEAATEGGIALQDGRGPEWRIVDKDKGGI
jgi:hypothetical protein